MPRFRIFSHIARAPVAFPLLAAVLLALMWSSTDILMGVELQGARRSAAILSRELLGTYNAQVVRALDEIQQTLKLVKYAHEQEGSANPLPELQARALLPHRLIFTVSIADPAGNVVASTSATPQASVADEDYFKEQRDSGGDVMSIGRAAPAATSEGGQLHFGWRLNTPRGEFAGLAIVAVDAMYFVSAYEEAKLGKQGMLGLLGTDGVYRVRRVGDRITVGDKVTYSAVIDANAAASEEPSLITSPLDGVRRYVSTGELYGFPFAVVVGLSEDEQLAAARHNNRLYVQRAAAASVLVVLITVWLGRMSWQLARSRERENQARIEHAKRIEYLAFHDSLTGLPNRSLFSRLLAQSIAQAHRHKRQLAVAFLDLDRFKHINDALGHDAGDQLLQEVARRLGDCVRESDTIARLGGDEFVILLPELAEDHYAATVARKILAAVAAPYLLAGHEFRITASIGICIYPQDGLDEQTLTKHADLAMYQAKEEGKNNFQFYSEKLNANSLERMSLESSLRHALARDEFRLHYQAKRDIRSGSITGMEALLRWEHPDLGTVAPLRFIPIAEETGLIVPIGRWVLLTACSQNVAWQQQGLPRMTMAVNLSARQFNDDELIADVANALRVSGMDAALLELELPEALLIRDLPRTLDILTRLKALGVRLAIDDFGTGYASLTMLQRFPLDTIKIDRSFIRGIAGQPADGNLTDAIIAMGRSLSLTVVAQGVENRDQADFLRTHACDELQGFYFARPVPADQATWLLKLQSPDVTYMGSRAALSQSS